MNVGESSRRRRRTGHVSQAPGFSFRLFLLSTNNYLQTASEIGYEHNNNPISPPFATTWSRLQQAIPSPLRWKAATFITNTRNDDEGVGRTWDVLQTPLKPQLVGTFFVFFFAFFTANKCIYKHYVYDNAGALNHLSASFNHPTASLNLTQPPHHLTQPLPCRCTMVPKQRFHHLNHYPWHHQQDHHDHHFSRSRAWNAGEPLFFFLIILLTIVLQLDRVRPPPPS